MPSENRERVSLRIGMQFVTPKTDFVSFFTRFGACQISTVKHDIKLTFRRVEKVSNTQSYFEKSKRGIRSPSSLRSGMLFLTSKIDFTSVFARC